MNGSPADRRNKALNLNLSKDYENETTISEISSVSSPINNSAFHHNISTREAQNVQKELDSIDESPVDVDEADVVLVEALTNWLIQNADIVPSRAITYSAKFVQHGLGSLRRLSRKVQKDPNFLKTIGINNIIYIILHICI